MKNCRLLGFVVLVAAVLCTPSLARAQYFGGFGNYMGGYGGYGTPIYGNPFGNPLGNPFFGNPYGTVPGLSGGYFNSGYGYSTPYYPSGYNRVSPIITPGFGASEPLRMRPTLYPAVPEPSREVIAAALEGVDKGKARIEIHVPAADAKVSFDGVAMKQAGLDRVYMTPQLNPASNYQFNITVVWQDDRGQSHTIRRLLKLQAGDNATIDLRDPD